jgi:hypothetical protein
VLQNSIDLCDTEIALRSWFSLLFLSQTERSEKNEYTSSYLRKKQKKKGGKKCRNTKKPNTRALPRPPKTEAHKEHQQKRDNNNNSPGGRGRRAQKQTNGSIQDLLPSNKSSRRNVSNEIKNNKTQR